MSFFPINKWRAVQLAITDSRLSAFDRMLFTRLMEHHNTKTGLCCPSINTLAEALHYSGRNVRMGLRRLKEYGYVQSIKVKGIHGTNAYVLTIPEGKFEYNRRAKVRLEKGKATSAKPMNKPLKEPLQSYQKAPNASTQTNRDTMAVKQALIEKALVNLLGGDEVAWRTVQELSNEIEKAAEDYEIHAPEVATTIAEKIWGNSTA